MPDATTLDLVHLLQGLANKISQDATRAATTLTQDFLGVVVAGSRTTEAKTVLATMGKLGRGGPCSVPASPRQFDAPTAALITATTGYSIGLTDTHAQSITHPGSSVIPTALSVGQQLGSPGKDVIEAVILGCEAVVRIGAVVNPSHRSRGFHPTATCNVFGAAVATSYLLGADARQMAWALGLAGSMASGIYEFRHDGAMLMALHAGWPAAGGITAAYLAADGFTGPTTVLEGTDGFFHAFADRTRPELLLANSGRFGVEEISLRPYCACRYAHAGIDALEHLWSEHGKVSPSEVEELIVYTHRTAVEQECEPTSPVGARLSTRFNLALALVHGPQLTEVDVGDLEDPVVQGILARTVVVEDPALTDLFPRQWACRVCLRLRDGSKLEYQVETPKGEPENPMSSLEISGKFHRLADPVLGLEGARRLEAAVQNLAGAPDVMAVATALSELVPPSREVSEMKGHSI